MATPAKRTNGKFAKAESVPAMQLPSDDVVQNHADALKVGEVLNSVAQTRASIEAVLANLSDLTLTQIRTYEELKRAIQLKQEEIEALHGKEAALEEFDSIKARCDQTRLAWKEEEDKHNRERQASETEWNFQFDLKKKADVASLADTQRERQRQESERVYQMEQGWKMREAALAERETELKTLREQAATFDAKIKSEADKQVAIATNSVKRDYMHQMEIAAMTAKSEIARLTDRVNSLAATVDAKNMEITKLQASLTEANERASQTVRAALESASGRKALDEVRETLSTQQPQNRK